MTLPATWGERNIKTAEVDPDTAFGRVMLKGQDQLLTLRTSHVHLPDRVLNPRSRVMCNHKVVLSWPESPV